MEQMATPAFTSERLTYTKFTPADFTDYLGLATDASVMQYITGKPLTEAEARTRFDNYLKTNQLHAEAGFFRVNTQVDGVFIGLAKLVYTTADSAEIGYSLLPAFWGRKYASEIVSRLVHYAAAIPRLTQLIALVDSANTISAKVLTNHLFIRTHQTIDESRSTVWYQLRKPFCHSSAAAE